MVLVPAVILLIGKATWSLPSFADRLLPRLNVEASRAVSTPLPGRIETATLYELTDLGRSLDVPLAAMTEWADRTWQAVEAARHRWDRLRRASR